MLITLILIFISISTVSAENITIDNSTDIQDTINTINNNDTINLKSGIYKQSHIEINKDTTIQGIGDVIIDAEKNDGIIISNSNIKLTLRNITFANALYEGNGGAISFYNTGELVIDNCNFINNTVVLNDGEALGGAIYTHGTSNNFVDLQITNSNFINNSAVTDGGAINTKFGNININNCLFSENTVGRDGGAISSRGTSNVIVENSKFINNRADEWGGAINNWLSDYSINNCILTNNYAGTNGGAVSTCGLNTLITNTKIYNNTASEEGGAIDIHRDSVYVTVVINHTEFLDNNAPDGKNIYIQYTASGSFNFESNYWGEINPNSSKWSEYFNTNGICESPKTWLNITQTTISSQNLTRAYNSPYDFTATFFNKYGEDLKNTEVIFKLNNNNYSTITDSNGVGKLSLKLTCGKYDIVSINPVTGENSSNTVSIVSRMVENKDLKSDYLNAVYKIRIVGDDGNYVGSGEIVSIQIGNKNYKVKTSKDGYASLKITSTPGKYTIKAYYKNQQVTNSILIKQVLKAKSISKKKSKKIKYTATLKSSNGQAIKNKKITFKINKKTLSAKTNSKGIAKIYLKNLKTGKHKITITYVKDTIKKTISVTK